MSTDTIDGRYFEGVVEKATHIHVKITHTHSKSESR